MFLSLVRIFLTPRTEVCYRVSRKSLNVLTLAQDEAHIHHAGRAGPGALSIFPFPARRMP